ncbi:helix-turn-helix domain-containing protein [Pedobacter sp. MC2016-14]|uniref:helix-turn-helix domain-containing protein n=1 Tax=Pedobacter sp. MC2016-14 TaxID=2897327 RepID=UPI001E44915A|nr:helix-turn-helix transcriptional regulator [Pedobacter sp. MC2016-14]MCD0490169.1 helix-turn-helix domain-containing protein [Pedobacter sp. MC2016-14]
MEKTIGRKIRSLRQKQGKSQAQIAVQIGISIPAYSKIETGITDINITRLKQIADLFEVTTDSLLTDNSSAEIIDQLTQDKDAIIAGLQNEVISLQKKLIGAYEEVHLSRKY